MEYKICTKCGINKSFAEYYKAKRGKFGLSAHCIECDKIKYEKNKSNLLAAQKEKYKQNPEEYRKKAREYYKNNKDKIAIKDSIRKRQKRLENHTAALAKDAEYREKNKDRIAEYKKNYAKLNKERIEARRKDYYKENKESISFKNFLWADRNREKSRSIKKRWAKTNPEKVAASKLRRRRSLSLGKPKRDDDEWETFAIKEIYNLAVLRNEITGIKWHVDHKVPLVSEKVCGLHCAANLDVIPAIYNLKKNNLYWEDMP